jgi:5-hydroxyisourate hydrolase-like protein (transthyretin family)
MHRSPRSHHRRLLLFMLAALVVCAALLAAPAGALAGTVQGTVYDFSGPVAGASVELWRWDGAWTLAETTASGDDGQYVFGAIGDGSYTVAAVDQGGSGYATVWYGQQRWQRDASAFLVAGETGGIDLTFIDYAATLSGFVLADGSGVPGLTIEVWAWDENAAAWSMTGEHPGATYGDGSFAIPGLPQVDVQVRVVDPSGTYVSEFYQDAADPSAATPVMPGGGDIQFDIGLAGVIAGVVQDDQGQGLAGISLQAFRWDDDQGDWAPAGSATSDDTGVFALRGLTPGEYRVQLSDPLGLYAGEVYDDAASLWYGTPLWVDAGVETTIAPVLGRAGTLRGTVQDAGGGPLAAIEVTCSRLVDMGWGEEWADVATVATDGDGRWTCGGLPAGDYQVRYDDPAGQWVSGYWQSTLDQWQALSVPLAAEQVVELDGQVLQPAAHITGTVTGGGEPLAGVYVRVERLYEDEGIWDAWSGAYTGDDGTYDVGGLPPAAYRVVFWDESRTFASEYYDDQVTAAGATVRQLAVGEVWAPVDADLESGATIAGTVLGRYGEDTWVLSGDQYRIGLEAKVVVRDPETDEVGYETVPNGWAEVDEEGRFSFTGLSAGQYVVVARDFSDSPEWAQTWLALGDRGVTASTATRIAVAAGAVSDGWELVMGPQAVIRGRVTLVDGLCLEEASIEAYIYVGGGDGSGPDPAASGFEALGLTTWTGPGGYYTLYGVPEGVVTLGFSGVGDAELRSEYLGNTGDTRDADLIGTEAGVWYSGHDAVLGSVEDVAAPFSRAVAPTGWSSKGVWVHFLAEDALDLFTGLPLAPRWSGVEGVYSLVDDPDWAAADVGASRFVAAPADGSNDGPHIVWFWAADKAGNWEWTPREAGEPSSCVVRIDTQHPTARTYAAAARSGRTAALRMRATDATPNGGKVTFAVSIAKGGKVVKKTTLKGRPIGRDVTWSFRCTLRPGKYDVKVTATDLAGNRSDTATARLTVR